MKGMYNVYLRWKLAFENYINEALFHSWLDTRDQFQSKHSFHKT